MRQPNPPPVEGETVTAQVRLNVLDMQSGLSAPATAVCPHAVEQRFAQCASAG